MKLATVILIIFLAFLFLKLRPSDKKLYKVRQKKSLKNKTTPRKSSSTNKPYHAVSIEFDSDACPAVKSMAKNYFLGKEAPRLPMPECISTTCHCKYIHHNDRRNTIRRPQTLSSRAYESTGMLDRRVKRGRRVTDLQGVPRGTITTSRNKK